MWAMEPEGLISTPHHPGIRNLNIHTICDVGMQSSAFGVFGEAGFNETVLCVLCVGCAHSSTAVLAPQRSCHTE